MPYPIRRRRVLSGMVAAVAGAAWRGNGASAVRAADEAAANGLIAGKDARLIVHKASPCEIETPAELLAEHALTPKELMFVRNNQQLPDSQTIEPAKQTEWNIEFGGLVEFPRIVTLETLRTLPTVEREMVVQCSGNGRSYFSKAAPVAGAPWSLGAMANVRFGGVLLSTIMEKSNIQVDKRAGFVTAEGLDGPPKPDAADFEHSLPIGDVLERSLVALTLNGEPLPAVHGGPVRFVTPGYYGTMHVKWLSRVRFEAAETANHHQVRRYRTPREPVKPGAEFEYGLSNSEPNWRMRIKSAILSHADDAEVASGGVKLAGIAFNDGSCAIDRIEVSSDGDVWRRAEIEAPESPFAWYRWRTTIDLARGEHVVRCRAIDALGRTQPLDGAIHWNPAGYGWNGVHEVRLKAI